MNILLLAVNAKYIHSSLALRSIKSFCKEYEDVIHLLETTINNEENEIIKEIYNLAPDILGISCYIWNMSFVRTLIPTLKKVLPDTIIVLGGPEVSYHSEELFRTLNIDLIMEGEGEETWKEYLDFRLRQIGTLSTIGGLVYREGNHVRRNNKRKPLDLKHLPFVYNNLEGLEHKIIYYEASRGCPFSCQYCLSSTNSGVRFVPLDKVQEHLQYFLDRQVKQVKFVDRTFNANKTFAKAIWKYLIQNDNSQTNFHFEIAAELLDEEALHLFEKARPGLFQFEIGVQTTNPEVLRVIKRSMSFEEISRVVYNLKTLGNIHLHLDLIAGLPLESYSSFKQSFNEVISLRPEQLQLGFLKLLKGSGLRASASDYGLIYKEVPPYEILYTHTISYSEMLRLHSIEELLERYYNSGRFKAILEYIFHAFASAFDFFEALSIYWEQHGYDKVQHNKLSYYFKLAEFCATTQRLNEAICRELIRFDLFNHELVSDVPLTLQTFNQTVYRDQDKVLLKDDDFIKRTVPTLIPFNYRQRLKKAHIEHFKYDVLKAYQKGCWQDIQPLATPCSLLFDYSEAKVSCIPLEGERT